MKKVKVVSLRASCDKCGFQKASEDRICLNCGERPPREKLSFAMKAIY